MNAKYFIIGGIAVVLFLCGLWLGHRKGAPAQEELDRAKQALGTIRTGIGDITEELTRAENDVTELKESLDQEREEHRTLKEIHRELRNAYQREKEINQKLRKQNTVNIESVDGIRKAIRESRAINQECRKILSETDN